MKRTETIHLDPNSPVPVPVQIADCFRKAILEGRLQPGDKLPPNGEIASQAGASCTAVQKALAMLAREGLITRKPRRGTFVNSRGAKPTVLLVFGVNLMAEAAYFYRSVQQCFQAEAARRNVHLRVFSLPLESTPELPSQEEEFLEATRAPGVVGALLFAIDAKRVSKVLKKIPCALYQPGDEANDLLLDTQHFIETALQRCVKEKAERLAYICANFQSVAYHDDQISFLLKCVARLNTPVPQLIPLMLTKSGREHEEKAYRIVLECCTDWKKIGKPPKVIIVQDDITMRPVSLALSKSGYDNPQEVLPIVRTIEEYEHHYAVPVLRYTISLKEVAQKLFERLDERSKNPSRKFSTIMIRGKLQDCPI